MNGLRIICLTLLCGMAMDGISQDKLFVTTPDERYNQGEHRTERRALVLTVDSYKQRVLDYNQTIKIATETFNSALETVKAIKTGFFPKIDATGTYQYNFDPQDIVLGSINAPLDAQSWQVGGSITQNIYTGGKLSSSYQMAKIEEEIASLGEDLSIDNVAYTAESTYWKASASKTYLDIIKRYTTILLDMEEAVQKRFKGSYTGKTDLLKVRTSLKEAELQVSKAEQDYTNNCIILNVLMGRDPHTLLFLKDSIQDVSLMPKTLPMESIVYRRPDYLIKNKEIEWQKEKGNLDRSEFLPKLLIGGTAGYGTKFLNLDGSPAFAPVAFAQLNIPLLQWGKSQHVQKKNKALTIGKELALSLAQDDIMKEVSTALNNISESLRQIEISMENLDITNESLDTHTSSYLEGKTSMLEVQAAQLSWLQANIHVIQSFLNNKLAFASYKKAISE